MNLLYINDLITLALCVLEKPAPHEWDQDLLLDSERFASSLAVAAMAAESLGS